MKAKRDQLRLDQPAIDGGRTIWLDEFGSKTNFTPTHGWCTKGKRLVDKVPHGHWMSTTCLAAMSLMGMILSDTYDGGMNGQRFLDWVRLRLVPMLIPGDTVIMDNLASHKVAGVREAIEAAGATVRYLPPYSPDFNPIEKAFSQIKRHIRRLKPRDRDALWRELARIGDLVTMEHAANYIRSCGYVIPTKYARAA